MLQSTVVLQLTILLSRIVRNITPELLEIALQALQRVSLYLWKAPEPSVDGRGSDTSIHDAAESHSSAIQGMPRMSM